MRAVLVGVMTVVAVVGVANLVGAHVCVDPVANCEICEREPGEPHVHVCASSGDDGPSDAGTSAPGVGLEGPRAPGTVLI